MAEAAEVDRKDHQTFPVEVNMVPLGNPRTDELEDSYWAWAFDDSQGKFATSFLPSNVSLYLLCLLGNPIGLVTTLNFGYNSCTNTNGPTSPR